jgi:hypothetical protein
MSALTVDFQVDPKLTEAMAAFKTSTDRALLVTVENETLVLVSTVHGTQSETVDTSKVRTAAAAVPAAFVIFRRGEGHDSYALITYVSDDAKPRLKMMFSASAQHLRKVFAAPFSSDKRIVSAAELTPSLFAHESTDRQELMTEQERAKAQIAAMLQAEQEADAAKGVTATAPRALPGMAAAVSPDIEAAVKAIATPDTNAAVFFSFPDAKSQTLAVMKTSEGCPDNAAALLAFIGAELRDTPLFVFLRCDVLEGGASEAAGKPKVNHFVYYCPEAAKPKDKMRFSASKGSILMHIKMGMKIPLGRSIEIDDAKLLADTLKEVVLEDTPKGDDGGAAAAKKAPANAGFRLPGMGGKPAA